MDTLIALTYLLTYLLTCTLNHSPLVSFNYMYLHKLPTWMTAGILPMVQQWEAEAGEPTGRAKRGSCIVHISSLSNLTSLR